ncbi:MAG: FHA domain-containing protein [Microthrixaceae bacterium]
MNTIPTIEIFPPEGERLCVVVDRRIELGRECDGILIDDALLSRRHLEVRANGDQLVIEDLGSCNGTSLDGTPLTGHAVLTPGAEATAGRTRIRRGELVATRHRRPRAPGPRTARRRLRARPSPTARRGRPLRCRAATRARR